MEYAASMAEGVEALVKGGEGWGCDSDAGGGECFAGGGDVAGGVGGVTVMGECELGEFLKGYAAEVGEMWRGVGGI